MIGVIPLVLGSIYYVVCFDGVIPLQEFKVANMGSKFYDFQFNTRLVKSTIVHFQVETRWF